MFVTSIFLAVFSASMASASLLAPPHMLPTTFEEPHGREMMLRGRQLKDCPEDCETGCVWLNQCSPCSAAVPKCNIVGGSVDTPPVPNTCSECNPLRTGAECMHPGRSDNSCYARNPDGNCPTLTKACCDKGFVDNNDGRGCVKECGICPCFDIEYLTSLKLDSKSICTSETDLFGLLPKPISVFAIVEPDFADFIVACSGPLCTNESFEVNSCGAVVLPEHFDGSWDQFETAELENIAIESISQTQQDACVCLIEQAAEMAGIECSGDLLDAVPDDFSG